MFFKPFVLPEPPRFPAREVSITDFGAKENAPCTEAIANAIDGIQNAQMQNLYFKDISMNAKTCLTADTVDGLFMENVNLRQLP